MNNRTNETIKRLIPLIRSMALQGQSDTILYEGRSDNYMHETDMDIYWQTVGQYLIVYIETFGTNSCYYYRVYRCNEDASFDRKTVLEPELKNKDCICLFDYKESQEVRELGRFYDHEHWLNEFENTVKESISV